MYNSGLFEKPLRRSVLLLLLTEFFWGIGIYFTLPATTMPSYLKSLDASPRMIGLIAIVMAALPMLLQFFGRSVVSRFRNQQNGLVILHLVVISPYFVIPWLDTMLSSANPGLLVWLVIGLLAFSQMVLGFCIPVWLDMLSRVIPLALRGRYFGMASGAIAIGGILGGGAQMYLQNWLGESIFRGAFLASGICYTISMSAFYFTPIPKETFDHPAEPSVFSSLKKGLSACRPGSNYSRFVVSTMMFSLGMTITPFLVVYATDAKNGLGLPFGIFSFMTFTQAIGGASGAVFLGWLVDRYGPRWPWIALISMISIVTILFPYAASNPMHLHITIYPILLLCSLFTGIIGNNWAVSAPAMLEFSPQGDKSSFIAISNILSFFPAAFGPMLMASVITNQGYTSALRIAVIAGIIAALFAFTIRGKRKTDEQPDLEIETDTTNIN